MGKSRASERASMSRWVDIGVTREGYAIQMANHLYRMKMKVAPGGEEVYVARPNSNGWLMATPDQDEACIFENSDQGTIRIADSWYQGGGANGYDNGNWYLSTDYHQGLGAMQWPSACAWSREHVGLLTDSGSNGRMAGYNLKLYKGNRSFYACGSGGGYSAGNWESEPFIQISGEGECVGRPEVGDNCSPFLKAALGFFSARIIDYIGYVPGGDTVSRICDFSKEDDLTLDELGHILKEAGPREAGLYMKDYLTKEAKDRVKGQKKK